MIQAVFFDFNGVIIDDEPLQMKAYQEVLGREGLAVAEADYYGSLGMDDRAFVRAAYERAERELDEETLARVIEGKTAAHRKLLEGELPLFPGVVTLIKALKRQHSTGLVSMARRTEIDHVLERAALQNYFDVIVSAEDATACKPDPSCYNNGLEFLNRRRGEAHAPTNASSSRTRRPASSRHAPRACARSASPTPSPNRPCARPAPTPSRAASPTGRPTPSTTSLTLNGGSRTECR
jgi:beta-phosphoglucomutase